MKIKKIIQSFFKKTNVLINEQPAHEEISENNTYVSEKDLCSFKSWRVKIDFTKSGKSNLCRIFDNKTHNSYFFFRSLLPSSEEIKKMLSEIDEIIKDESFETKIERERKKSVDDERVDFSKIQNVSEELYQKLISYSSNYSTKGTDISNVLLMCADNAINIASSVSAARTALQTQNRLLLENIKLPTGNFVTFDGILGKLSEIHLKKSADYGDSFSENYQRMGEAALYVPIYNKIDRIRNLYKKDSLEVNFEAVIDSWLDLASYAIMAIVQLSNK